MKGKSQFAWLALLLPMMLIFMGMKGGFDPKKERPLPPENAVGEFINGVPHPLVNRLVNHFQDGGTITSWNFVQGPQNWWMVRRGTINGTYRSEKFAVSISNGFLVYTPVWFFVCSSSACNMCTYIQPTNTCECGLDPDHPDCVAGSYGPVGTAAVYASGF